jgi:hypothetical protein
VPTKRLNQQVRRNDSRFPEDFMFQLTKEEADSLRSQFATSKKGPEALTSQFAISKKGRGGRRTLPYAVTEQGVAMLSSVLSSERAIEVNIAIMHTFVKLRKMLESNEELNRRFAAVIRKLATHDKYFTVVFDELKKLHEQPARPRKQIVFKTAPRLRRPRSMLRTNSKSFPPRHSQNKAPDAAQVSAGLSTDYADYTDSEQNNEGKVGCSCQLLV